MAKTMLREDLNFVQRAPLEITAMDGDLNIIAKLDDEPNDVGGLTSQELKAEFDKAGNTIKTYLNGTLIPELLASDATERQRAQAEQSRQSAEEDRVTADGQREAQEASRAAAEQSRVLAEQLRVSAEENRETAESRRRETEDRRAAAEQDRENQETGYVAQARGAAGEAEHWAQEARNASDVVYVGQGSAPTNSKLQINLSAARQVTLPEALDTTGDSAVDTMSQRAITRALAEAGSFAAPVTVTVGAAGDYASLGEAIGALSRKYPAYRAGGVQAEVKILSGTTVRDQIAVKQLDLQYITVTAEDAEVPVDSTGWTTQGLDAHDLRDDVAFFGGENAAKLPTIGCKFKLVTKGAIPAVGYFANRGSSGVILAGCGFDGFHDGIIANNESSVTAREALCTHMDRWGIHARHNGEISARSIDLTHSGVYAAYADRIADIDIRYATLSKSGCAIYANNCSRINANGAVAYYCVGTLDKGLVCAASVSTVNVDKMDVQFTAQGTVFTVKDGSAVNAIGAVTPALKPEAPRRSQEANALTVNGVIYDDAV